MQMMCYPFVLPKKVKFWSWRTRRRIHGSNKCSNNKLLEYRQFFHHTASSSERMLVCTKTTAAFQARTKLRPHCQCTPSTLSATNHPFLLLNLQSNYLILNIFNDRLSPRVLEWVKSAPTYPTEWKLFFIIRRPKIRILPSKVHIEECQVWNWFATQNRRVDWE